MEKVVCVECDNCRYDEEERGWMCNIHKCLIATLVDDGNGGSKSHVTPLECIDFEPVKSEAEEGLTCSLCGSDHAYDDETIGLIGMLEEDRNYNDVYLCEACNRKVWRDAALNDIEFFEALRANLDAKELAAKELLSSPHGCTSRPDGAKKL